MQIVTSIPKPLFELKGVAGRIDLSAWISGLSYAAGLMMIGMPRVIEADTGALIALASSYLAFLASVLFIQRHMRIKMTANSFGSPKRLTTDGIFKLSRNPIYVMFFLPLAALSVFSVSAAIAAIAIYVTAMNFTIIRKEERELLAAFGDEFAAYMQKAPRWLA